jgi:hypothetical protein
LHWPKAGSYRFQVTVTKTSRISTLALSQNCTGEHFDCHMMGQLLTLFDSSNIAQLTATLTLTQSRRFTIRTQVGIAVA